MSLAEKFSRLIERAQKSVEYWRDVAITDFTRDLHARMTRLNVNQEELARRMGTSRPYVTKLLDGGNFTLNTMVKASTALDGVVRVHIADRETVTRWFDEYRSEPGANIRAVASQNLLYAKVTSAVPASELSTTKRVAHG
jgi:predicted transcriptional regulator